MNLTLRMIAYVQSLMLAANHDGRPAALVARLERIERYLIERYNRED